MMFVCSEKKCIFVSWLGKLPRAFPRCENQLRHIGSNVFLNVTSHLDTKTFRVEISLLNHVIKGVPFYQTYDKQQCTHRSLTGVGWEGADRDSKLSTPLRERKALRSSLPRFVLNNLITDGSAKRGARCHRNHCRSSLS